MIAPKITKAARIVAWLDANDGAFRRAEIAAGIGEWDPSSLGASLFDLARSGLINRAGRGKFSRKRVAS